MADISKITLPSGITYNIKDAQVRQSVWGSISPTAGRAAVHEYSPTNDTLWGLVQDILLAIDHSGEIENVPGAIQSITQGTYNDIFQTVSWLVSVVNGLVGGDAVVFIGVSTNKLTDGGTEAPTGTNYETFASVPKGSLVFYKTEEFIKGADNKWHALGSLDTLGALAYKDNASGGYTPVGTISQPTFTGSTFTSTGNYTPTGAVTVGITGSSNATAAVSAATSGTPTYTPAGTVHSTFSGATLSATVNYTPTGSVGFSETSNKTAAVSQAASGTTTYKPAGSVSSNFTGATKKITVSRMTGGSVNVSGSLAQTVAINQATGGATTYQPAGVVSAPTISATTAGTTTTIKQVNAVNNMVSALTVAEPGATAPANAITYYSVANETLSLKQIGATTAAPITTTNATVKTGDASYAFSAPTFTGTAVRLTGSVTVPNSFTFNGTMTDTEYDVTPSGSVDSSFTGTAVRLVTGNIPVPSAATFSGGSTTITATGTPSGSIDSSFEGKPVRLITGNISVPNTLGATFAGNAATISVTGTPVGTVSKPTFTGSASTITVS